MQMSVYRVGSGVTSSALSDGRVHCVGPSSPSGLSDIPRPPIDSIPQHQRQEDTQHNGSCYHTRRHPVLLISNAHIFFLFFFTLMWTRKRCSELPFVSTSPDNRTGAKVKQHRRHKHPNKKAQYGDETCAYSQTSMMYVRLIKSHFTLVED